MGACTLQTTMYSSNSTIYGRLNLPTNHQELAAQPWDSIQYLPKPLNANKAQRETVFPQHSDQKTLGCYCNHECCILAHDTPGDSSQV